jgi:hypothetical protein
MSQVQSVACSRMTNSLPWMVFPSAPCRGTVRPSAAIATPQRDLTRQGEELEFRLAQPSGYPTIHGSRITMQRVCRRGSASRRPLPSAHECHSSRFAEAIQQRVIQVPSPLQGTPGANGLLRGHDRPERPKVCAIVRASPQSLSPDLATCPRNHLRTPHGNMCPIFVGPSVYPDAVIFNCLPVC